MAGVYLKQAIREKETSTGTGPKFEYAVSTCQGWRNTQEDIHLVKPNFEKDTSLFAVFDGHNGAEVARYVGDNISDYIHINKNYHKGQIKNGLTEAFYLLDCSMRKKNVLDELRQLRRKYHPELPELSPGISSGTTAVVCLFKNNAFHVANIGDTRCVLCRNGKALALSNDNKPEDPEETTRIEKAGGFVVSGRIKGMINVSRAFGDHMFKQNEQLSISNQMIIAEPMYSMQTFNPVTDQFLVLMCDGIWNSMTNDEVIEYVHKNIKHKKLSTITEDIIDKILPKEMPAGGIKGKDNMTIMIVKFVSKKSGTSVSSHRGHGNTRHH